MKKIKTSIIAASLAFAPCAYAQEGTEKVP